MRISNYGFQNAYHSSIFVVFDETDDVQEYMSSEGIYVMAMAATWLKPDISDGKVHIPRYRLFCKDKVHGQGGGVGVFCHVS